MYNTQLSKLDATFNVNNIIYGNPVTQQAPPQPDKPGVKIEFKRIPINVRMPDKKISPLVVQTPQDLFSLGVLPNEMGGSGYTLGLVLYEKDGPTAEQKIWFEKFTEIVDHAKRHLVAIKDKVNLPDLELSDLKNKFSPVKYQKDKETKALLKDKGPSLYPKLIENKKTNTILSIFTDEYDNPINPMDILKRFGKATCAITIDSIFVGAVNSLQIKVYQCIFTPTEGGMKPLMTRSALQTQSNPLADDDPPPQEDVTEDEIENASEEEEAPPREPTPPPVVEVKKKKAPKNL